MTARDGGGGCTGGEELPLAAASGEDGAVGEDVCASPGEDGPEMDGGLETTT